MQHINCSPKPSTPKCDATSWDSGELRKMSQWLAKKTNVELGIMLERYAGTAPHSQMQSLMLEASKRLQ